MTTAKVIDTNVLMVANGRNHEEPDCILACVKELREVKRGIVVIDNQFLILNEYKGIVSEIGQPGVGDALLLWLLRSRANRSHCEQVDITINHPDETEIAEFPSDNNLSDFDPSDRKFVAVAIYSKFSPAILNATDTDWWNFRTALQEQGIDIQFLCPAEMIRKTRR